MSALIVLNVLLELKKQGIQTSEYFDNINPYFNSGEINFRIDAKQEAMDRIKAHFMEKETPQQFHDFDGYRLDFKDWWFNIRPSNTEPYLRFIAEAKSQEKLDMIISETNSIIKTMS
jgi:phosphomannomutase